MRPVLRALLTFSVLGAAAPALGRGFDTRGFDPPSDPWGYVAASGAKALAPLQAHAGAIFDYADAPLRVEEHEAIESLDELDLAAAVGLFQAGAARTEVGFFLPIVLRERGHEDLEESGAGDLRTDVKVAFLDRDDDALGLSLRGGVRWPTGRGVDLASNERFAAGLEGSVERRIGFLRFGADLGYEWLDGERTIGPIHYDDRLLMALGLAIAPLSDIRGWDPLELVFEVRHSMRVADPYDREEEAPVEVGGAIRWTGTLVALVGAGAGLNDGAGAPDARFYCMLGFTF